MQPRRLLCAALVAAPTGLLAADTPDFSWLAGAWCFETAGRIGEETWLPERGGLMVGVSRTTPRERAASFEFLRIEGVAGVPNYVAQPGGRPPTSFRLTEHGPTFARFENPAHDFPQFIEYRRDGNALEAMIGKLSPRPGEIGAIQYTYRMCAAETPSSR